MGMPQCLNFAILWHYLKRGQRQMAPCPLLCQVSQHGRHIGWPGRVAAMHASATCSAAANAELAHSRARTSMTSSASHSQRRTEISPGSAAAALDPSLRSKSDSQDYLAYAPYLTYLQ